MSEFPREIEMGNGPNIVVGSQAEHDAFMAAARQNAAIDRKRQFDEALADGTIIVALFNDDLARPDAPLSYCGPFDDIEQARTFAAKWTERLTHPAVRCAAGVLPSPSYFERWIVDCGNYDLAEESSDVV